MMINVIVIGIAFTVVVKDKWLCVDMGAIITANMVLKMQKGAFARWHCLFKEIWGQSFFVFFFTFLVYENQLQENSDVTACLVSWMIRIKTIYSM